MYPYFYGSDIVFLFCWLTLLFNGPRNTGLPTIDVWFILPTDQFVAYDATCTHAGCTVDYDPASHLLSCPCHGAQYDPAHGAAVLQGPADTPLTSLSIHIDSMTGSILLQQ